MEDHIWTKVTVRGKTEQLDDICAVMCLLDNGLMIEDYSDFSCNGMYGELVDDTILNADRTEVAVSLFVPEEKPLPEWLAFLRDRFAALGMDVKVECSDLHEENWAEGWKKYYHPIHIGRLSIVPAWEEYREKDGEVVVRMDPGMAFGTGTHETTRLCMRLIEQEIRGGEHFLDVGCGSGILSICAARLGAASCAAYDIDPVAVEVARKNVEAAGLDNIVCGTSDLLSGVDREHGLYDFAVANIVADILLRMLPGMGELLVPGARLVLSGIIAPRADEIKAALGTYGFRFVREVTENDWVALLAVCTPGK